MRRATTPTHTFSFPHEYVGKISKILVTYSQNGEQLLNKTEKDGTIDGNKFYFTLTQEETNLFNTTYYVEVQIRILTSDNVAVASDVAVEPCEKVLNDEVL